MIIKDFKKIKSRYS